MTSTAPDHTDNPNLAESQPSQHVEATDSTSLVGPSSSAVDGVLEQETAEPSAADDQVVSDDSQVSGLSDAELDNDDLSAVRDEESISDYMERLLTRVNRLTASDDASTSRPETMSVEDPSRPLEAVSEKSPSPKSFGSASEEAPGQRFGTTRRALPPESRGDLITLRDLANETSRDAIDVHSRQQTVSAASGKLWVTMLASVIAILLLEFSSPGRLLACASAAVSVIVAMFFALQFLNQTRMLSDQLRSIPVQDLSQESTADSDSLANPHDEHHDAE